MFAVVVLKEDERKALEGEITSVGLTFGLDIRELNAGRSSSGRWVSLLYNSSLGLGGSILQ